MFHAGDGNLHPLILYDANAPGELERAEAFAAEILRTCVAMGGVLTGEHGVGVEKRDLMGEMFNDVDLAHQERIKCVFDPAMLLNPGKVFPTLHRCAELGRMHVHRGAVASRIFRASEPWRSKYAMRRRRRPKCRASCADAAAEQRGLEVCGGGSKRLLRSPVAAAALLDMSALSGITDYDPDELVVTARSGTPLAEIEAALAERRQMLAFEPFDHGPMFGAAAGRATLGGIVAANVSGSRRVSMGAARDHILGFTAVSGAQRRSRAAAPSSRM